MSPQNPAVFDPDAWMAQQDRLAATKTPAAPKVNPQAAQSFDPDAFMATQPPADNRPGFVKSFEEQNKPIVKKPVSMNPADYPPGTGRIAPPHERGDFVGPFIQAWEAVREGQIGRAFGISTETAEARKEDPSTPLLRFNSHPTGPIAGVERGLENFATGLTTPTNLLLAVGSGGLGALEGQLGRSLVSRLASAGFSGQMLYGAVKQIPALRDAWNKSDWQNVQQILTEQVLGGKFAYGAGKHAIKGSPTPVGPTETKPVSGADLADAYQRNPQLREAIKAQDPVATRKILQQEGLGAATQGPQPVRQPMGPPEVPKKILSDLADALKPQGKDVDFGKDLRLSLPEIKQTEAETGQPVKGGVRSLLDNVKLSKQRVWDQFAKLTEPLADTLPDASSIPQAIRNSVTKTIRIENPELAAKIDALADSYKGQRLSFNDLAQMWHEGNAELANYYAKNPGMQRSQAAGNPDTAATAARVDAIRNVIHNHLDANDGAASRAVMDRYGALTDLEGHATRHYNDTLRSVPTPLQALVSPEAIVSGLMTGIGTGAGTGNPLAGAGAGAGAWALTTAGRAWLNRRQSIDARIDRAIKGFEGAPAELPRPVQQLPLTYKGGIDVSAPEQAGLPFEPQVPPRAQGPEQWRMGTTGGIEVPASSAMHTPGQGSLSFGPQVPPTPPAPYQPLRLPFTKEGVNIPTSEATPTTGQTALPFEPQVAPFNQLRLPAPSREEFQMPPAYTKDFVWKPPENFPDIEHKNYIQRWNPTTGRYDIINKEARGGLHRYPTRQQVLRSLTHR